MDEITLENYRCFRDKQIVRLAPLTLLVGENSTGKTSFMAMIRALWGIAHSHRIPDFNEEPYDLGSFDRVRHKMVRRGGHPTHIGAGFSITPRNSKARTHPSTRFDVTFEERGNVPIPIKRRITQGKLRAEIHTINSSHKFYFQASKNNIWRSEIPNYHRGIMDVSNDLLPSFTVFFRRLLFEGRTVEHAKKSKKEGPHPLDKQNYMKGLRLAQSFDMKANRMYFGSSLYASAPVRSKPRRIYDLSRLTHEDDPEGDKIPIYFAKLYFSDKEKWDNLRVPLEAFGQQSGLFDEISVSSLGKQESGVFQVQIRKFSPTQKGPKHNLVDVGYGVSQVLPIITELLRPDRPSIFLYQQPEVHLHPSAQAALGSLFCKSAGRRCQLIVETHSDHLLDRVRMDIRDKETELKPDDVSILFFERSGLSARIHSLRLDQEGNVLDAPDTYRRFFLEETDRSLWKKQP